MIIKVCGMRDAQNISDVIKAGADWIGMIFYAKSPRYVTDVPAINGDVKRVGVFVNDSVQNIITATVNYKLDILQLHGNESPTMLCNLRKTMVPDITKDIKIIKTISVKDAEDLTVWHRYANCADAFLFDTKCRTAGGSGKQFDWNILNNYDGKKPFLLSGGIGPDDAQRLIEFRHPQMIGIDTNSCFETAPAIKDAEEIKHFIEQIKRKD